MNISTTPLASTSPKASQHVEILALKVQPWGFSWPLTEMNVVEGLLGANPNEEFSSPDVPVIPDMTRDADVEWIGPEAKPVRIGDREYRLSYVFLGTGRGTETSAVIDPKLPVGESSSLARMPSELTCYTEYDPATRRAFLEWIDGGRRNPSVPGAFLLLFVYSLELAIVRGGRHDLAGSARQEIDELLKLHGNNVTFRSSSLALLEVLSLVDPNWPVRPIFASAKTNTGAEMPFDVRRYLGEALRQSSLLDADPALLFVLQQPGTRLDAHIAQNFAVIHHHWAEDYSYRFEGGIEIQPTQLLSIDYECLDGETHAQVSSSLPDPASASVPAELREFFMQCSAEAEALRDLPVSQQVAAVKALKAQRKPGDGIAPPLRPDFEDQINARLAGQDPVRLAAEDVLGDLFEDLDLPANRKIPVPLVRRMQCALDGMGVGFEPDVRYGLPAGIRPGSEVVLFREEPLPFEQPSDAFHLAQSAMTLSAIGTSAFVGLELTDPAVLEHRLPYRYRFSDRELRRLQASFLVMASAASPRKSLEGWARLMKRMQRTKDIYQGFGLAFHAQHGNPLVKRFAVAISKALRDDDSLAPSLLREVKEQAALDPGSLIDKPGNVIAIDDYRAATHGSVSGKAAHSFLSKSEPAQSRIKGLPAGLADMLAALAERPRLRTELNEIARGRQLQLSGALEQLNEWSLVALGTHVTRGHHTVRINPEAVDAVELLLRQS